MKCCLRRRHSTERIHSVCQSKVIFSSLAWHDVQYLSNALPAAQVFKSNFLQSCMARCAVSQKWHLCTCFQRLFSQILNNIIYSVHQVPHLHYIIRLHTCFIFSYLAWHDVHTESIQQMASMPRVSAYVFYFLKSCITSSTVSVKCPLCTRFFRLPMTSCTSEMALSVSWSFLVLPMCPLLPLFVAVCACKYVYVCSCLYSACWIFLILPVCPWFTFVCRCMYVYVYMCVCVCVYIYIYIYIY
jgi:hypothetical protein